MPNARLPRPGQRRSGQVAPVSLLPELADGGEAAEFAGDNLVKACTRQRIDHLEGCE